MKKAPASCGPGAVLFRTSNGSNEHRAKFSTIVQPDELPAFQASYIELMHTNLLNSLLKRDKAKERRREKVQAASLKRIEETGGKPPAGSTSASAADQNVVRATASACVRSAACAACARRTLMHDVD